MNVPRILLAVAAGSLVVSCNTFKPVSKQQADYTTKLTNTPASRPEKFIDKIEINPVKPTGNAPALQAAQISEAAFRKNEVSESVKVKAPAAAIPAIENCSMLQFKYAMMLDIPVEEISHLALYSFVDEWYGTRYRFGGTTKKGIDCSSFTQKLYAAAYGIEIPRTAVTQYAACRRINKDELKEGDLIFFHTTRSGISHVGVYLGNDRFVHASSSRGVVISNLTESYYVNAYRASGRIEPAETGNEVVTE